MIKHHLAFLCPHAARATTGKLLTSQAGVYHSSGLVVEGWCRRLRLTAWPRDLALLISNFLFPLLTFQTALVPKSMAGVQLVVYCEVVAYRREALEPDFWGHLAENLRENQNPTPIALSHLVKEFKEKDQDKKRDFPLLVPAPLPTWTWLYLVTPQPADLLGQLQENPSTLIPADQVAALDRLVQQVKAGKVRLTEPATSKQELDRQLGLEKLLSFLEPKRALPTLVSGFLRRHQIGVGRCPQEMVALVTAFARPIQIQASRLDLERATESILVTATWPQPKLPLSRAELYQKLTHGKSLPSSAAERIEANHKKRVTSGVAALNQALLARLEATSLANQP